MKSLYVIGDSNIYGDEQLNDNLNCITHAITTDIEDFNYPSLKTYPYYIPSRSIKNVSIPGLSVQGIGDLYLQLVLPHLSKDNELLIHVPPISRDIIYQDCFHYDLDHMDNQYNYFKEWCRKYAGLKANKSLFKLCLNLFSQLNFNPGKLDQYETYAPSIAKFLDEQYWSSYHGLNLYKNLIHTIEITAPCKVYYVFQTFNLRTTELRENTREKLTHLLKNLNVDITDRTIDDNWIFNMKELSKELDLKPYPRQHFHPKVHEEYYQRYVKTHFPS